MNTEQSGFRIDYRILSIILLLGMIPLMIGSWWLFSSFENTYLDTVGSNLSQAADMAFGSINSYLQSQIIEIAGLAESPALREAVKTGNLDLRRNLDTVRKEIPKMEADWAKLKPDDPRLRQILENPASKFLSRYAAVNQSYIEILVTDFLGRVVASSRRTGNYYYAGREWWKEAYGDGVQGTVYVGDAMFDKRLGANVMELAQPMIDPQSGIIGQIKVTLGFQNIHSIIGSFRAAPGAMAVLIRAKGEVISAPGYNPFEWRTYPPTFEILAARDKERPHFVSGAAPRAVFGLAQTNFMQLYPNLNWIVVSTVPVNDVLGPFRTVRDYFMFLAAAVFVAGLIAALLLSRGETRPLVEQDAHLETL
jgi:hypothetical protein